MTLCTVMDTVDPHDDHRQRNLNIPILSLSFSIQLLNCYRMQCASLQRYLLQVGSIYHDQVLASYVSTEHQIAAIPAHVMTLQ